MELFVELFCVTPVLCEKFRSAKLRPPPEPGEPLDRIEEFPSELRSPPGDWIRLALPRSIDRPKFPFDKLPAEKSRVLGDRVIELGERLRLLEEPPPEPEKLRTLGAEPRLGPEKLRVLGDEEPPSADDENPRMLGAEPRDIAEPPPLRDIDGPPPPRDEKLRLPPPLPPPPMRAPPPPPPPPLRPPPPPPRPPPPPPR